MVVSEGAISNIMGGMENTAGVRLHSHRHKLKQRFDILRKLGQGTYGKVQLAVNKDTGQEVAIKTIKKAKIETEQDLVRIRREIQIMSSVQHPQIIHIYEVFENREKMVLVMEYAAGGELYDYLSERKVLSVDEARRVFRQVSSAVYYCHKHKICHRDLKLENILLDIEGNAKIADFGLSNVFDEKRRLDTFCGSPLYASPEIVKGVPYIGPEVDCWSLGVLLYTLVYGAMPFDGSNFRRLVRQITQGDYYEPPTPSTASPLIRGMLTVTADKRANIADICNHWWVNDGETVSCLDEAETLANQTPVRLDLLLSLAPKHISSEHMVIAPEEEETSQRSDDGQGSASEFQLPPPPPVPPPPNGAQATRSLSLGALNTAAIAPPRDAADLTAAKATGAVPRRTGTEDKRRRESEARSTEPKKRKEADASATSIKEGHEYEEKKKSKKKSSRDEENTEKKKSSKKKEVSSEVTPMEVDENVDAHKTDKMRETSVESISGEAEKEKKKSSKTKDANSSSRETAKNRQSKKKGTSEESSMRSRDSTPKAASPLPDLPKATRKSSHVSSEKTNSPESKLSSIRSPSNKSVISAISTDGTLKASDSSISTRHSVSPPKPIPPIESKPPIKQPSSSTVSRPSQEDKVKKVSSTTKLSKINSAAKISKNSSSTKVSKNSSEAKISTPVAGESTPTSVSQDTDEILKETVSKIKEQDCAKSETLETDEKTTKRKTSSDAPATHESVSSKDSSQHSSVSTTPARSRTGSESSNETRSGRNDSGSRRGSKIFSKAAMWDNMCTQQQNEKPPAADKTRKTPRPGGLNMSDLSKKFEEKPPSDRKKSVVGAFKISDVKKSFENKSSDRVGGFRRTSTDSSGEFKKEDSVPLSPSRSMKKEASLPPPGKHVKKVDSSSASKEKQILIQKETSVKEDKPVNKLDSKVGIQIEKPSAKSETPSKSTVSPTKETIKKEKSPVKESTPKREISIKRDVTTPRRTSPTKEKPKAVSIAIKKTGTSHTPPKRDVVTPDADKTKTADKKDKPPTTPSKRISSPKFESSDSSDSESEAERLLRQLSERRERIEAAKKEKLRKVSQQQQEDSEKSLSERSRISRPCNQVEKDTTTNKKSALPPLETPSDTPDDIIPVKPTSIPKASMITDAEQPSAAKFATLPRGFKSRDKEKEPQACFPTPLLKEITAIPPEEVIAPSPREGEYDKSRKKSEVEIVLNSSAQNLLKQKAAADGAKKRSSYAEIQLSSPAPQEYKAEVRHNIAPATRLSSHQQQPSSGPMTATGGDGALQRAPRERIIPIMMEEHLDDDTNTSDSRSKNSSSVSLSRGTPGEGYLHSPLFKNTSRGAGFGSPHLSGVFGTGSGLSSSRGSVGSSAGSSLDQPRPLTMANTASPEPIRKCRRERIIPISMEGEDGGSTPLHPSYSQHSNTFSQSSQQHGMGRRLTIDRPDSLSSNDDEDDDEEEDEDGFQSLTAESLFSTLLNKMRNLTKKMSLEESARAGAGNRARLMHQHPMLGTTPLGFHHSTSPFSSIHSLHKPLRQTSHESFGSGIDPPGFWSSLYSPPREISRQNSEVSGDGRGGERTGVSRGVSGSSWTDGRGGAPLSRDHSQDTNSSSNLTGGGDSGTAFNTLPRVRNIEIVRSSSTDEDEKEEQEKQGGGEDDNDYENTDNREEGGGMNSQGGDEGNNNEDGSNSSPVHDHFSARSFVHRRPLLSHDRFISDM